MTLIFRYLLKRLVFSTALLSTVLILAVWLTQSLRFLDMIVNRNVSLQGYFCLVGFLIPDLVVIILPICLFISILFVYNKAQHDHELTIWRSVGLSDSLLARPALALSFMVCVVVYLIHIYIIPFSFKHFRDEEFFLRQQFSNALVQEGRFNSFNNVVVYVKQRYRSGKIEGVFIHNQQNSQKPPYSLIAEEGQIAMIDGKVNLTLKNGERHETDPKTGKLQLLKFDTLHYDLSSIMSNPAQERIAKPYEKNLKELLNPDDSLEEALKTKYIAAAHQRILQPLFIFAEALLALNFLLKGYYQRRGRQKKIIAAVLCAFTLRATMMSLINMNGKWEGALHFAYALYSIVLLLNAYFLFSFKKMSFKIPFAAKKT